MWRWPGIGSVNAALISIYFALAWGGTGYTALTSPFMGLDDPAHWTAAAYFRDLLGLRADGFTRAGALLGGVKFAVAVAFVAYLILFLRGLVVGREPSREIIETVLTGAVIGILAFAVPALAAGDASLTRHYATELLMVIGAGIVLIVEPEKHTDTPPASTSAHRRETRVLVRSFVN